MLVLTLLLVRTTGQYVNNEMWRNVLFAIPVAAWLIAVLFRMTPYIWFSLKASGYNREREKWILDETRTSRRAFQILMAMYMTAGTGDDNTSSPELVMSGVSRICTQPSWQSDVSESLSRLPAGNDENEYPPLGVFIAERLSGIVADIAELMAALPENNPVVILFESASSFSHHQIQMLWKQAWLESGITQPVEYADESGPAYAEKWLNTRIRDNAVLLVVGLQIAPEIPKGTGEAIAVLLLGNRLTQKTLEPFALLHRPDSSPETELNKGLALAAYNVPMNNTPLHHLWLSGLNTGQRNAVTAQLSSPLLASVPAKNIYDLDSLLGQTGCVATWLAVAAAAQAAKQTLDHQLIISSYTRHDAVCSAVISPVVPRQEKDS